MHGSIGKHNQLKIPHGLYDDDRFVCFMQFSHALHSSYVFVQSLAYDLKIVFIQQTMLYIGIYRTVLCCKRSASSVQFITASTDVMSVSGLLSYLAKRTPYIYIYVYLAHVQKALHCIGIRWAPTKSQRFQCIRVYAVKEFL